MILILACLLAAAAAAPTVHDQRQDGDFNIRVDVADVLFLLTFPSEHPKKPLSLNLSSHFQSRADDVLEAFIEPTSSNRVDIDGGGLKGGIIEVVIPGSQQPAGESNEVKLIGATEQCGPGRERDPVALTCRDRSEAVEDVPNDAAAVKSSAAPPATPDVVQVIQETPATRQDVALQSVPAAS